MPNVAGTDRQIIALVGEARLFQHPDGKFELVGGSDSERAEIEKWAEAVMSQSPDHDSSWPDAA